VKVPDAAEYWTIWSPAGIDQVCSKHKTYAAAEKAAKSCEAEGGARHRIILAIKIKRRRNP
jgi:hypothetical protein